MLRPKQILWLLRDAGASWSRDSATSMGAALAYYSLFSIAPLLVIVIAVAGIFFGADAVQGAVFAQVADLMGEDAARAVAEMLQHANRPKVGGLATLAGVSVLLLGASSVFGELQNALDRIWRVPLQATENSLWRWLRARLLTFGMVLAVAFLVIVSLVLSVVLSAAAKWWAPVFGAWEGMAHAVDLAVSFVVLGAGFAMIYKIMPRAAIRWRDVWIGAAVTAALFSAGKFLIGLYLGKSSVASSFGAFGSLALMMVWVYYSAQIFLFGAEFTWVFANKYGSRRDSAPAATRPLRALSAANEEVMHHAARVNAVAPLMTVARPPPVRPRWPRTPARASLLRRHLPELAVAGAFLAGVLLSSASRSLRSLTGFKGFP